MPFAMLVAGLTRNEKYMYNVGFELESMEPRRSLDKPWQACARRSMSNVARQELRMIHGACHSDWARPAPRVSGL
jgi:hypothetical protein